MIELSPSLAGQIYPFKQGWLWFRQGFSLWLRCPWLILVILVGYQGFVFGAMALLHRGGVMHLILLPVFLLGMMNIFRALDEGRQLSWAVLWPSAKGQSLLLLGALWLVIVLAFDLLRYAVIKVLWLTHASGQQDMSVLGLFDSVSLSPDADSSMVLMAAYSSVVLHGFEFVLKVPFLLMPVLISTGVLGLFKAYGHGVRCLVRQWRAVVVYAGIFMSLYGLFMAVLFLPNCQAFLLSMGTFWNKMLFAGFDLVCSPVLLGGLYAAVRDIVGFERVA